MLNRFFVKAVGLIVVAAISLESGIALAQSVGELRSTRSIGTIVTTPTKIVKTPTRIATTPTEIVSRPTTIVTAPAEPAPTEIENKPIMLVSARADDESVTPPISGPISAHPLADFWSADFIPSSNAQTEVPLFRQVDNQDTFSEISREPFIPDTTHEDAIPIIEDTIPPRAPMFLTGHRQDAIQPEPKALPAPKIGTNWAQNGVLQSADYETDYETDYAPVRGSGFYVGTAMLFAKPHFKEAFQVSSLSFITGQVDLLPFQYGYELSPRVYFGFKSESGMGVRASFWGYDEGGTGRTLTADGTNLIGAHVVSTMFPSNIFAGNFGDQLTASDYLQTKIVNLVGTYETEMNGILVNGAAGLRYAKLNQGFNATVTDVGNNFVSNLNWLRRFEGMGPCIMVDASKRLGDTRFAAFAQGGGSLLFGQKTLRRDVINDQTPNAFIPPFLRLDDADEVVGIGELNFGLEWGGMFANGYCLSVRGLYEGQLWAESGAPTLGFLGFEGLGFQIEIKR